MALAEDLERIAALAAGHAEPGEELAGVVACAPDGRGRVYLCAFERGEERTWLALDDGGDPVDSRGVVRDAVSVAALCELAADTAGGGSLEELRTELLALRLRENPPGIDAAEDAALELERVVGVEPRLASAGYLDDVGAATMRLERALGQDAGSPFVAAMKEATTAVEALFSDVESNYKRELR